MNELVTAKDPLWKRHREIIRIVGFWQYFQFVTHWDWVEGWWLYLRSRKYYEDMEWRFGCIQEHACGLSKTNYDREDIYRAIDERVREECDAYVEDGVNEGWLKRIP